MRTLLELSVEYRAHAQAIAQRMVQIQELLEGTEDPLEQCLLQERLHMLAVMHREARELAVLTERYYDRGYRRNGKYTI